MIGGSEKEMKIREVRTTERFKTARALKKYQG